MTKIDDGVSLCPMAGMNEAREALRERWPKASISPPFTFEPDVQLTGCEVLPRVSVGYRSYMNPGGMIRENVQIGRYCSIGRGVTIAPGDHPMDGLTTHRLCLEGQRYPRRPSNSTRSVRRSETAIGHDVWIGDRAIITAGVIVGTGAVIGAGAVVTKDVAPYSVVGGVPARKIRDRFPPSIAEALLASEWWTIREEGLKMLDFNDIQTCIDRFDDLRRTFGTYEPDFTTIG